MKHSDENALSRKLTHQSYEAIGMALQGMPSPDLLKLMDSASTKIGDTAADLLGSRNESALLIEALLIDRLRTAVGRVRATNILNKFGRAVPESTRALVHCLGDRSDGVVSNALFGIVFMRRRDLLPKLREYIELTSPNSVRRENFRNAIRALEEDDPWIFAPGFADLANVWCGPGGGGTHERDGDAERQ